jgi:exodeoxyribonuclease VII small subunit
MAEQQAGAQLSGDEAAGEALTMSFEEALRDLEAIVSRLEAGDLSLEESLGLFERGQRLVRHCGEQLEAATLRVEQLTSDGEIVAVDLEQ